MGVRMVIEAVLTRKRPTMNGYVDRWNCSKVTGIRAIKSSIQLTSFFAIWHWIVRILALRMCKSFELSVMTSSFFFQIFLAKQMQFNHIKYVKTRLMSFPLACFLQSVIENFRTEPSYHMQDCEVMRRSSDITELKIDLILMQTRARNQGSNCPEPNYWNRGTASAISRGPRSDLKVKGLSCERSNQDRGPGACPRKNFWDNAL